MLEELVVTKIRLNNLDNMTFKMLSLLGTQLSTWSSILFARSNYSWYQESTYFMVKKYVSVLQKSVANLLFIQRLYTLKQS